MTAMSKLPSSQTTPPLAVQTILYGAAPFFAYPWKPILNDVYGGGYTKSYKHFRMQHMDGWNLVYHVLCMIWQLSSNYALLGELDKLCKPIAEALSLPEKERGARLVTRTTSALWIFHLARTAPTPSIVKFASVCSILAAHNFLGELFDKYRSKIIALQGVVEAVGIQKLLLNKPNAVGPVSISYLIVRSATWKMLSERVGVWKEYNGKVSSTLVVAMAAIASSGKPLSCVLMGLFGWMISMLTGSRAIYYWSAGMMATIAQGIAHKTAGEAGTLEVLQNENFDQTSYELSHVTFFPNLVFQAIHAHLKAASQ